MRIELQGARIAIDRLRVFSKALEACAFVEPYAPIPRGNGECAVAGFFRVRKAAQGMQRCGAIKTGTEIRGITPQCLLERCNSGIELAQCIFTDAKVEPGVESAGVEARGLLVCCQGLYVAAYSGETQSLLGPCLRIVRQQVSYPVIANPRVEKAAQHSQARTFVKPGARTFRVDGQSSIEAAQGF